MIMTRICENDTKRVQDEEDAKPTAWIGSTVNHALQCFHIAGEDDLMDGLKTDAKNDGNLRGFNARSFHASQIHSVKLTIWMAFGS